MAPGKLIVVKYGGSVLEDGQAFRRAAEALKEAVDGGGRAVVVVSALKGATDQLLAAAEAISPDTPLDVVDHIIGLGEEQSVRLMVSALKSVGVDAVEVTPHAPGWPIFTDENYGDAEPILEECRLGTELGVRPLIERGKVPVLCGFVGMSLDGNFTTLGRGGGDTTAVILTRCLGADELVLVKDVGGIYTADPRQVEGARPLDTLSAWEAHLLSSSGAKVLHGKVFRYKPDDLKIRLVSRDQSLGGSGTVISGTILGLRVDVHERPVLKLTMLGDVISSSKDLGRVIKAVADDGGEVLSLKGAGESLTLYIDGSKEVLGRVHALVESSDRVKAVAGVEGKALITITGRALDDLVDAVQKIGRSLSDRDIGVHGLVRGQSSVRVLVDWDERRRASASLEGALRSD